VDQSYKNIPLLGDLESLVSNVHYYNIEQVLIAVEPDNHDRIDEILAVCRENKIQYNIVADVYDTVFGNVVKNVFQDVFKPSDFNIRRILDLIGAIFLLIAFFPMFIVTAIAIKFDSRGTILYSQLRSGKDGVPFRIYKFRSMVQDAEVKSGPVWAQKQDPRITRMGNFMRKTRIDELPQLINVFKGDMSFVGPRPERPFFVDSFKQQIPLYANRLQIKPGVTGWAQVRWGYDETLEDVKEKLRYDLEYVNNRSAMMDIKIYFLTIWTVVTGKGQ
jgi:exopolysaccharide biosynthesis polyprenyl glycosylphosphotransferase